VAEKKPLLGVMSLEIVLIHQNKNLAPN